MKSSVVLAFVSAIFLTLLALPANAQATRTWVSGVGDDANPCSRTAPCKTFAGAISHTSTNGEINCLDPGGFGTLTITKSIEILCDTLNSGVLASGTVGITVSSSIAPGSKVVLSGLDINGSGGTGTAGTTGVNLIGPANVVIRNSTIRNFSGNAVNLANTSGTARVLIVNSFIFNNGFGGTTAGGINVQGTSGAINNAEVLSTIIDSNTNFNLQVTGTSATLVLAGSQLTGTAAADIIVTSPGQVISYGNNVLRNAGAPTSTVGLQ
jgi:hypothetical protein